MEAIMAAKEISVKKYVVRLSEEERERLETLIRKGKSLAGRLLKARILLKADVSDGGEGWSDSRIIDALETSASMVYRVRKQLGEEGFEAVLNRKQRATPAVARIFDGEKEAKLIALACSKPPKGRARWTLRLLENKVVELGIVDRASDSTIGRTLKKTLSSRIADSNGSWSCENALAEALTSRKLGEVAVLVILPNLAGFPTVGATEADSSRLGRLYSRYGGVSATTMPSSPPGTVGHP
jgi:hypothetical protein